MHAFRKSLFLFSTLLLAGCSLAGNSSSSSSSEESSESSSSEVSSSSSESSSSLPSSSSSSEDTFDYLPTGTDEYYEEIPSGDVFNELCTNVQDYINLLDAHLFWEDTSFSISYNFYDVSTSNYYSLSSLWDIQMKVTLSTKPKGTYYVDTYTVTYRDYATKNEGYQDNLNETVGIADQIVLDRGEKRSVEFDDFPIDARTHDVSVTTSEQLWFAASRGYKPVPVAGSSAETIYEEAKAINREYISNDDSDAEKTTKIFAWLGNDVKYDMTAYTEQPNGDYADDCYYLEGIFNRHIAVCDGMAKAFVLMESLENIPAVRVSGYVGNDQSAGHAWNYVRLDGEWYAACPTSNNTEVGLPSATYTSENPTYDYYEITNKELFLVSNTIIDAAYTQTSFPLVNAPSDYGYYANTTITYGDFTHNLVATNYSAVKGFINLLGDYPTENNELKVMEFQYSGSTALTDLLSQAVSETGVHFYYITANQNEVILISAPQ